MQFRKPWRNQIAKNLRTIGYKPEHGCIIRLDFEYSTFPQLVFLDPENVFQTTVKNVYLKSQSGFCSKCGKRLRNWKLIKKELLPHEPHLDTKIAISTIVPKLFCQTFESV